MQLKKLFWAFGLVTLTACGSCSNAPKNATPATGSSSPTAEQKTRKPEFQADSAFQYIARQLEFGPRVPGSESQQLTAVWLESELKRHGAEVSVQRGVVQAYDGKELPVINLIGHINPKARMHVLLMSHWDSRPIADHDQDPAKRHQPVPAANDGASGVGVLLELARLTSLQLPEVGIDIFLTDVEDYGAPDDWKGSHDEKWWAMGTQMWCKQVRNESYHAEYGILLDMVGAPDATFYREYYSERYASTFVDQVWDAAARLGYGDLFVNRRGGGITDDHVFVNQMLGIPTLDIIDTRMDQDGSFFPYWHTTEDTLDKISPETLGKVGRVLVALLW